MVLAKVVEALAVQGLALRSALVNTDASFRIGPWALAIGTEGIFMCRDVATWQRCVGIAPGVVLPGKTVRFDTTGRRKWSKQRLLWWPGLMT